MATSREPADLPVLPLGRLLLLGARAFAALTALALLASLLLPPWAVILTPIVVGLPLMIHDAMDGGFEMLAAGILAMCTAISVGVTGPEYVALRLGKEARGLSVLQAPAHPGATWLSFVDGEAMPSLRGSVRVTSRSKSGSSSTTTYSVAPVVPAGWQADAPVTLWATCAANTLGAREWAAVRGGPRVARLDEDSYEKAVLDALSRHRLRQAPGAPVIRCGWRQDIEREVRGQLTGLSLTFVILWVGGVLLVRIARAFDPGPRPPAPPRPPTSPQ